MTWSTAQLEALQVTASLSASLSLLGSAWVLDDLRRKRASQPLSLGERLVALLSTADALSSFCMAIGVGGSKGRGDRNAICQLQAFGIQFFTMTSILLTMCMAANLYLLIVRHWSLARLERMLRWYVAAAVAPSFALALGLGCGGAYGDAAVWCWISSHSALGDELQIGCFYSVVFAAVYSS